jgi:hypothetical protein
VFLAEQIRQQQLASELQSHLRSGGQGLGAMQALLGMGNKPKHNGKVGAGTREPNRWTGFCLNLPNPVMDAAQCR